jgi:hypothetical protein
MRIVLLFLLFVQFSVIPQNRVKFHVDVDPQLLQTEGFLPPPPASQMTVAPVPRAAGAGLIITPTFDSSINAATQTAINNAIAFYESTITTPITVSIFFSNMNSGLGQSVSFQYKIDYASYRAALAAQAVSSDDAVAVANTPTGSTNPVDGSSMVLLTPANGRALGFSTPGLPFNYSGSPCPSFTGDGCIGINVAMANQLGVLNSSIEHEIDEVLGLGSGLFAGGMDQFPHPEDLFRWASAGHRIYGINPSTTLPCAAITPRAFLSFDGGVAPINEFNNCNNGGDYGDWIMHTPSLVQDAFTNASANPALNATSSEVRVLDVIGYNLVQKKRRGQITSQ